MKEYEKPKYCGNMGKNSSSIIIIFVVINPL